MNRPLRVIKFGGTSLRDATCIARVIEIIRAASCESEAVVVVSAMSGVTNDLIEAASQSKTGNEATITDVFKRLRQRHNHAVNALIESPAEKSSLGRTIDQLLEEGDRLCQHTTSLGELTLQTADAIASIGERLSAPLVAAALRRRGVASEAIEATELVVTDASHGAAEPCLDLTRERCQARLLPLLKQGIVPVVTGFIGATTEGVLTTLGRGGSDYSATILGATLDADEVVIWTDVDGMLTADPSFVPNAHTIPEISYRGAAELAKFGAKVLHAKALRPLVQRGIPLWVRNTFAPTKAGTKITPNGSSNGAGVPAVTALSDAALITISGPGIAAVPDVLSRTLAATRDLRSDVMMISRASSQTEVCLVVPSNLANRTVDALRREFALELADKRVEPVTFNSNVAILTVVGTKMQASSKIVGRIVGVLDRENVKAIAIVNSDSNCNASFVVAKRDMQAALVATHRLLQPSVLDSQIRPEESLIEQSRGLIYPAQPCSASAD